MLEPVDTGVLSGPKWHYDWQKWPMRYSKRYSRPCGTHVVLCIRMAGEGKQSGSDPTGALVVAGRANSPAYEAKWRRAGRQVKRRVGPAWLERAADDSGWVMRRGRVPEGYFDEKRATVRMAELIAEHDREERAIEAGERERRERGVTFRELAAEWLEHLQHERGAKPSTLSDYRYMLAEPGTPHRRGKGKIRLLNRMTALVMEKVCGLARICRNSCTECSTIARS